MKPRIDALLVTRLALNRDGKRIIEELERAFVSLLPVFLLERFRKFQKSVQRPGLRYHQVSEMSAQRSYEIQCVETFRKHAVKLQER